MKRIAVLMTCFNRVQTTLECLRRLFAQELPDGYAFDVWLVDDASPDGTGEKVKASYPQVNVIQSSGNLFWCKGMRLAWDKAAEYADYDFYLWLNDDVELFDGAIRSILLDAQIAEGVIVGTLVQEKGSARFSYGYTKQGRIVRPNGQPQIVEGGLFCGNVILIPRSVYEVVGKIYGGYQHACGDSDYCMMVTHKGCHVYCSSKIVGVCPQQPQRYLSLKGKNLKERMAILLSPKGLALHDIFIYRYRHWGIVRALLSSANAIRFAVFARETR